MIDPITNDTQQKRRFWGNMIWISAISLVVSVCAGGATLLIQMNQAYTTLSTTGSADPQELAGDISSALIGTAICIPFALAALALFIIALVRHRKFSNPAQAG